MESIIKRRWIRMVSSGLIGLVFIINIQAGMAFFISPDHFLAAYQINGVPGKAAISGIGLLFLMWNIPYAFALWNPIRFRTSIIQACLMQGLGVIGESIILFRIPDIGYASLTSSIKRFIYFDSIGLLLLVLAFILINPGIKRKAARG